MADTPSRQLPEGMLAFEVLKPAASLAPRLGKLSVPGRAILSTPHYIANTSRGVVPHLTQDTLRKHTRIDAVYLALEDFLEKAPQQTPPAFSIPCPPPESPLRRFVSLQKDALLVLGPRRVPAIAAPAGHTNSAITVHTSVGFQKLSSEYYASTGQKLRPDILIGMGDVMPGHDRPSLRRIDKMGDRTAAWMRDAIAAKSGLDRTTKDHVYSIFAPVLPISRELQSWYLDQLVDDMLPHLSGLALYSTASLAEVPDEAAELPRLSLEDLATPQKILHAISLGMDLFTIPFIGYATDAGIVLDFEFPVQSPPQVSASSEPKALGIDFWLPHHAADLSPLTPGCECYACKRHHRAYLQHLLMAKEMLGWVLIQIHNHHVMDRFFAGVRKSIENGTFEEDRAAFERVYQDKLPDKTGQGPRVRGYQYKSGGPGEVKRNPPAYKMLNEQKESLEESSTPGSNMDARDLEEKGFAEAQK